MASHEWCSQDVKGDELEQVKVSRYQPEAGLVGLGQRDLRVKTDCLARNADDGEVELLPKIP